MMMAAALYLAVSFAVYGRKDVGKDIVKGGGGGKVN